MGLNQTQLRGMLARILSVDKKYVVPKQGNWYNPQCKHDNVANWCAYQIRSSTPRTLPFYDVGVDNGKAVNGAAILRRSVIDLQFVGPRSEELAMSVAFWPMRGDVKRELKKINGALMNNEVQAVSSRFAQSGANTIMAWNTTIDVMWYDVLDTTQQLLHHIDMGGKILVKPSRR